MRGGRVVKATTWARLRVTARPGGGIDCEDRRPVHWSVGDKEPAQPVLVDPSLAECLVEAAVAAGELWLEAERGDRGDGAHAAQDGVAKLEEGVAPGSERTVELLAERAKRLVVVSDCR